MSLATVTWDDAPVLGESELTDFSMEMGGDVGLDTEALELFEEDAESVGRWLKNIAQNAAAGAIAAAAGGPLAALAGGLVGAGAGAVQTALTPQHGHAPPPPKPSAPAGAGATRPSAPAASRPKAPTGGQAIDQLAQLLPALVTLVNQLRSSSAREAAEAEHGDDSRAEPEAFSDPYDGLGGEESPEAYGGWPEADEEESPIAEDEPLERDEETEASDDDLEEPAAPDESADELDVAREWEDAAVEEWDGADLAGEWLAVESPVAEGAAIDDPEAGEGE